MMISIDKFKQVMQNAPLITIDFICKDKDNNILLGKRVNKPAQGYYFTPGGRVFKNETIDNAIKRLSLKELGCEIEKEALIFNGIYEHIFNDSIFEDVSTHCINMAFDCNLDELKSLPKKEHEEYKYFSIDDIMSNNEVHKYVKDFFIKRKGIK